MSSHNEELATDFSLLSVSVIIDKLIEDELGQFMYEYEKLLLMYPQDNSILKGEYRIIGNIPSQYFKAISISTSQTDGHRFDTIGEYIKERLNEVVIIRKILKENGFNLPIIDTVTGIDLESSNKMKVFK